MTDPPTSPTVWIIDDDLGFVWWLGEIFTAAGFQTVPALSCRQAVSLMKRLGLGVDLIVVNPAMAGVSRMLKIFKRVHPQAKIITIQNHSTEHMAAIDAHATLERPSGGDLISRLEWLEKVRKLLKIL